MNLIHNEVEGSLIRFLDSPAFGGQARNDKIVIMFNFLKKKKSSDDPQKMGMLQRLAMKKLEAMNPSEREKLMQQMLSPESINKNKDKILDAMEKMKSTGQISDEQIETAKKRLGL